MCSNEQLALLYQETQDKKSKEKIFKIIFKNVEGMAKSIYHYYKNELGKFVSQDSFFEDDIMQEAKLCLLKCIENYNTEKNTLLSSYYWYCLSNHLSDVAKTYRDVGINEMVDSNIFNWINTDVEDTAIEDIDNKTLYSIFNKHINSLPYSKPVHRQIFQDYYGLSENCSKKESFGSLANKYLLSRMAVKKIVDKYFALLKQSLEKSGDIDRIQEYL